MRIKRLMLNKKNRLRTSAILLLFIFALPISSFYLSDRLVHKIVTPLYKRLEPVTTDAVEVWEVAPLTYYEVYSDMPELSSRLHPVNESGLVACALYKGDAAAIKNVSGDADMVIEKKTIRGVSVPFVKNNMGGIEVLNGCIEDVISLLQRESRMSTGMLTGKDKQQDVSGDIKTIEGKLKDMRDKLNNTDDAYNGISEVEEFVKLQDDAMDKLEISAMLNDGKEFYITQEVIYKSLDLYNRLILRIKAVNE